MLLKEGKDNYLVDLASPDHQSRNTKTSVPIVIKRDSCNPPKMVSSCVHVGHLGGCMATSLPIYFLVLFFLRC